MRRRFKCNPKWINLRCPARCAEPDCQTGINSGERAFYYPSDQALSTAVVAVTAKRPNATLTPTGSTTTHSKETRKESEVMSCLSTKQSWSEI
jgi:hypothetical protein